VNAERPGQPIASWRPGQLIWPHGRTKLLLLGGVGSRTGDAERAMFPCARFLAERGGYDPRRDVLELTYAGRAVGDDWQPQPYGPADTRRPLADTTEAVASALEWYRAALPSDTRFCLIGYSLGGVVALDGATLAVARDRAGWHGHLPVVITLASPLRGTNAGAFVNWAWLVTTDPDPLGAVGPELDARWGSPDEQTRVERRAAFLRAMGTRVLTLADPDDAVVRPDEALLPAPAESPDDLLVRTERVRPGSLGHGALLDEPACWRRILAAIGPQESLAGEAGPAAPEDDRIERELRAIKERMRAQGRLH